MNTAAKVATGSRRRVFENGPDVMNSDDEDAVKEDRGDVLTDMYAPGCASLNQARLTPEQAATQRASSSPTAPEPELREPPRSQSRAYNSSDDDDLSRPEWIWSQTLGHARRNKAWVKKLAGSALALPAPDPEPRKPTPVSSDTEDQGEMTEDQKRAARIGKKKSVAVTRKAPEPKPVPEAKASSPVKGQESPGTKVPKPMETRSKTASRAGGLRPGGGSGQTDTCVAQGNPSKT
jgi:hypothetical protein